MLIQQFSGIYIHLLQVILQLLRFLLIFYDILLNVVNLLLRLFFISVLQHWAHCNSIVLPIHN